MVLQLFINLETSYLHGSQAGLSSLGGNKGCRGQEYSRGLAPPEPPSEFHQVNCFNSCLIRQNKMEITVWKRIRLLSAGSAFWHLLLTSLCGQDLAHWVFHFEWQQALNYFDDKITCVVSPLTFQRLNGEEYSKRGVSGVAYLLEGCHCLKWI